MHMHPLHTVPPMTNYFWIQIAFQHFPSSNLNHQVNGSSGVKPPHRTARATGAASAIARARSPPWICRICWWDPKGISPLPREWGASWNALSSCPLPAPVMGCSRSLLRTSHSCSSFSSGNCYRVPFGSASTSHQQWMDGWMAEQELEHHSWPGIANRSTS